MNVWDVVKLILVVATPTLLGMLVLGGPRWWSALAERRRASRPQPPEPIGLPIEKLAADLRRLLRLHGELSASAHMSMRAHRLWAVEAAIAVRAVEAARALGVSHREPETPGALGRDELLLLLTALSVAGLTLPSRVGPFVR